jgi:hypothetical protein
MGSTFENLIEQFVGLRDYPYRSDPERDEARLQNLESTMLAVLEKLRDKFDDTGRVSVETCYDR